MAAAVETRRAQDSTTVAAILKPHASAIQIGPLVDGCFVNASFLVATERRAAFDAALQKLRDNVDGYADVQLFGPLPPYSFVTNGAGS